MRSFVIIYLLEGSRDDEGLDRAAPLVPLTSLGGKSERRAASSHLVGIPTRTCAVRSCQGSKYAGSRENREELQQRKHGATATYTKPLTSRGHALISVLAVTQVRICDCAVFA